MAAYAGERKRYGKGGTVDSLTPESQASVLLARAREALANARVPAPLYNNAGIWELERERIFTRAWSFLAHESEIPNPGDYVVRSIAGSPVIVTRDSDGELHALLNICPHRGNILCRDEQGNGARFKCSYHGWVYNNRGQLVGIPQLREGYRGGLDKDEWPLRAAKVDTYRGMIFGSFNPAIETLRDYLGGFEFYMDLYLTPDMEVYGPPNRFIANVDWKIQAENASGDGYHTPVTHGYGFELGYYPSSAATHVQGWAVHIPGRGHAIGLGRTPGMEPFFWYPPEIIERMEHEFTPEQYSIFKEARVGIGLVFPNLSMVSQPLSRFPNQPGTRFSTLRLFNPLSNGRIEVWTWCLVPKDASPEYREEVYKSHVLGFGPSGLFEQDDSENFVHVTRLTATPAAAAMDFPVTMGLESEVEEDFPGPGVAVTPYINDTNFRNFWATYLNYLEGNPPLADTPCDTYLPGVLRVR
jgi:phenylpropionate dioxygenase-like ring-hydroxylating dioxygenase large terminal subunit